MQIPRSARDDREVDLSIIVVNRNTRELLRRCLASVKGATGGLRTEVIVVDNDSNDGSLEMVASEFAAILIRNQENTGYAVANNQGIERSCGRHVMLLNSDTEVEPPALRTLVDFLDANPAVGAVGPALFYPDGTPQRSAFSFDSPWRHFCDMLALGRVFPRSRVFANLHWRFDFARTAPVDWVIGAALAVRREVIERVGVLDERFRIHCNDSDWCLRISKAGYGVYFVREAQVLHHSGETLKRERVSSDLDAELLRNLRAYYRKHFGRSGAAWFRLWAGVGFGGRFAVELLKRRADRRNDVRVSDFGRKFRAAWSPDRVEARPEPNDGSLAEIK